MRTFILLLVFTSCAAFTPYSNGTGPGWEQVKTAEELSETLDNWSGFCDGWDDGYQQALDDCLRVGVTPVCPVEPVGSDGYKTGFGKGYAKAQAKHCD